VVAPYPPGVEVTLSDGRRGVVAAVSQENVTRPLVRVGWDPSGRPVSPYEVDLAAEPDELTLSCVRGPGVPARDVEPPPLPARPEPSAEVLAEKRAERARREARAVVARTSRSRVSRLR
jgi:hypothetical protein